MKIIHTADWHIGKILHRQDLESEFQLFINDFIDYVHREKVDVVLISGDVFDQANPANKDLTTYYHSITKLTKAGAKVIITGGNHDSIGLLNAPQPIFSALNVHVIGGATSNISDEIIPIYDQSGDIQCIVLAVPFLRDRDLVKATAINIDDSITNSTALGIKNHYETLVKIAKEQYPNHLPILAMGHLYMQGAATSDSERDIHVGNLGGMDVRLMPKEIDYFALGHIHKPQRIGSVDTIRYCGSPIFLDFSEREYDKMFIELEIINHSIKSIKSVPIRAYRKMLKFSGNTEEVTAKLKAYKHDSELTTFIEIEVIEENLGMTRYQEFMKSLEDFDANEMKVLKVKASDSKASSSIASLNQSISDYKPMDILNHVLEDYNILDQNETSVFQQIYAAILEGLDEDIINEEID